MSIDTTEATPTETAADRPPTTRRLLLVALTIVAALGVGIVLGWALWGSDDSSIDGPGAAEVVVIGGGELTERHAAMLGIGDTLHQAIIEGDGDALAALFVPQGFLTDVRHRLELRVDDGSLAGQINVGPSSSYRVDDRVVIHGDLVIYTGSWGHDFVQVLRFTPSGDVRIITDTLIN